MYNLQSIIIVNAIGFILALTIIVAFNKNLRNGLLDNKLFFFLSVSILFSTIMEPLAFCFDKTEFAGGVFINKLCNVILFMINQLPTFFWALYVDYKIYNDSERIKKITPPLLAPIAIVWVASILNLFIDVIFKINPGNEYQRTSFFFITYIPMVVYVIFTFIELIKNRKALRRKVYTPLGSFMLLPIIGLIIQSLFYGISLVWVCASISLINVYINVQSDQSITDYLTGLFNRRGLENYLRAEIKKKTNKDLLAGIMIDVDKFKSINDQFGHNVGDEALENVGVIITKSINEGDFIARYAGDEFIIIARRNKEDEILILMSKIEMNTKNFNNTKGKEYKLSFSMGYSIYDGVSINSIDSFLKEMDDNMYKVKVTRR